MTAPIRVPCIDDNTASWAASTLREVGIDATTDRADLLVGWDPERPQFVDALIEGVERLGIGVPSAPDRIRAQRDAILTSRKG